MSSVITPSDRQQEDIEVENVGKVESDRDGTAFTGVIRHLAVNRLGSLVRRTIRVVLFFFIFWFPRSVFTSTCIIFQSCSRWGQPESKTIVSLFFTFINHPREPLTIQGSPPWVRYTSILFLEPSFLNSSSTYLTTRSVTLATVRLGTRRIENLPKDNIPMSTWHKWMTKQCEKSKQKKTNPWHSRESQSWNQGRLYDHLAKIIIINRQPTSYLQKAPSIPCKDNEGFLILPMS